MALCSQCNAEFDMKERYLCPIKSKRRLFGLYVYRPLVTQWFHGSTHDKLLAHAVDYGVKPGTKVFAARDGVVVDVVSHFIRGGKTEEFRCKANYVCLMHDDDDDGHGYRYSRYYHLQSACVQVGQRVNAGELLGKSGNTGYTFGPHLHFDVVDMHPKQVCRLFVSGEETPCVPLSFSRFPFPSQRLALQARICHRGTAGMTFRQLVVAACKEEEEKCILIVDNDEEMKEALPLMVGDAKGDRLENVFVLMIASVHRSHLFEKKHIAIELETHPNFPSSSAALYKPRTIPVHIDAHF